jgi:hypothetical protein
VPIIAAMPSHAAAPEVLDEAAFQVAVERERERSRRSGVDFSVLVAKVGEGASHSIATLLRRNLRSIDVVGRIGPAHVALLLPYAGDEEARALREILARRLDPAGSGVAFDGDPRLPAERREARAREVVKLLAVAVLLLAFAPICCSALT